MEQLQTWWVTALYMPIDGDSCMEIPGDCEVVKAADAQATIAALQAERDTARRRVDELEEREVDVVMLREDLEQRTAELAAAKHRYADLLAKYQNLVAWYDKQNGTPCEQVRHKQEVADLQAELERVRGLIAEYVKAKTDFDEKRLQEDHYAGKERYNRLVEAENALLQHRQGMEG